MPFQRQQKCIFHWRGRAWLAIGDRVKISRYSRRLMHRNRVTCELHDSYFRLMTIKHAIPRTAEVTHSDVQLWGDIEWAIELLYNSVKTGSQLVWRPDPLVTWCGRENSTQRRGPPGLRLCSPGERERHTAMSGGAGEVNMLQSLFSLQLPLTHNPFNKVRGICFFKEVFARLYYCVNRYSACIWVYMHIYYVAIQHKLLVLRRVLSTMYGFWENILSTQYGFWKNILNTMNTIFYGQGFSVEKIFWV